MPRKKKAPPAAPLGATPPDVEGVTWGSQTTREQIQWAIMDVLPMNAITIIEGHKKAGKSSVLASIVAAWTGGPATPEWTGLARGRVLICATEDPWGSVVMPRIQAAAGNLDMVGKLEIVTQSNTKRWPRLPAELGMVEERMRAAGATLLVLDPFDGLGSDGIDLCKTAGAAAFMEPLGAMCDRLHATAILSRNLTKSSGGNLASHGLGSVKLSNFARSILRCDQHPHDLDMRMMTVAAGNWCKKEKGYLYTIEDFDGQVGSVRWHGESDLDAEAAAEGRGSAAERDEWKECDRILYAVIGERWTSLELIRREIEASLITIRMLRRAKEHLKLTWRRVAFDGPGSVEWGPPETGWPASLVRSCNPTITPKRGGALGALGPIAAAQASVEDAKAPRTPRTPPPSGDDAPTPQEAENEPA